MSNTGSCTQSVSVAANKCTDASGNGNTASNTLSMTIDRTAPTVKLSVTNQTCTSFTINITSAADNSGGVGLHSTSAYAFKISGGSWQGGGYISNKSCTFSNLTASTSATSYSIVVRVRDALGNYSDTTITASTLAAVAQITNTGAYYPSIQEAVNAQNTSDIKLLVNRNESVTVSSGKTIVFNFNGKTWNCNGSSTVLINRGTVSTTGSGVIDGSKTTGSSIYNTGHLELNTGLTIQKYIEGWNINSNDGTLILRGAELYFDGMKDINGNDGENNGTSCMITGGNFYMYSGTIKSTAFGLVSDGDNTTSITYGGKIIADNNIRNKTGSAVICRNGAKTQIRNTSLTCNGNGQYSYYVTNENNTYGDLIIYNRSTNYGMTGSSKGVGGKVLATTNTENGKSQETVTIYNTLKQNLTWYVWTNANGQDDKTETFTTSTGAGNHSITIYKSSHKNETGLYYVHIYETNVGFITNINLNF